MGNGKLVAGTSDSRTTSLSSGGVCLSIFDTRLKGLHIFLVLNLSDEDQVNLSTAP